MATTDQTTRAGLTAKDVLALVEEQDIQFIRLWFTDILGQLKSFAVGKAELEGALEEGMGFDGSSITGFNRIEESDMIAMPDPSTFAVLPWRPQEKAVGRMFCDVLVPGGEPYEGDPRYVMRRALERAKSMGFDDFFSGPSSSTSTSRRPSSTAARRRCWTRAGTSTSRRSMPPPTCGARPCWRSSGWASTWSTRTTRSGPSQHEIDMRFASGLEMADNAMTYRITVKEIAMKYGVYATFMPKPLFGENGSGMHVHQSLFSGGRNAFFDPDDEFHLSATARSFIAGQLKHAREISALFAQWVNSYKRLVPGYEAPVYIAWSRRNRSALIRVPVYHPGKERATRCELRCPDPSCNPYLTFAGMLHAGLEGIEKGYELPDPMETNLYDLTADERSRLGIQQLPETLGEAIEEMANSELVLKALGEHVFTRYVDLKRAEWEDYRVQVSPWELERYLSVL